MKEANEHSCGREQDLIGFMYQELNELEALAFQRHLDQCTSCRTELSSFRNVRESVVGWRNESLINVGVSAHSAISSPAPLTQRKRSALAAVREFLNLAPLWMKGAVAFATVIFCVLAVIAVARFRQSQPVVIASAPAHSVQSQEEIEAIVKQRVQDELLRIRNSETSELVAAADDVNHTNPVSKRVSKKLANSNLPYSARRPLSKTERVQLASDLRLLSSNNDSDLDLLQDRINQ
jgi:anti-sigma factor RsiW